MREKWREVQRFTQTHPDLSDVLLAALLLAVALLSVATTPAASGGVALAAPIWVLLIAGIVPLAFRQRAPLLVLLLTSVPIVMLVWLGFTPGVLGAGLFIACYTVGAWSPTRQLVVAVIVTSGMLAVVGLLWPQDLNPMQVVQNLVLFTTSFAIGRSARARRAAIELATEQAALLAVQQAELARQQVTEERLTIARELHDVVAHSLGVIAVQAGVGSHVSGTDPEEARRALDAIATTSREALQEVRSMLGVLRSDSDSVDYEPRTSLADLPRLLDRTRMSGVPVEIDETGQAEPLAAGVELAACAVIREGLANAVRHAHGAPARVLLEHGPGRLGIEVRNGPGRRLAGTGGTGHGLQGMRERVQLWGGSMEASPSEDGGFRLRVDLPTGGKK
ncbi:MAG TPA: histidine kinase [Propionicimonas sp.]|nr:histidine kinase [Propionicimonas sp.]